MIRLVLALATAALSAAAPAALAPAQLPAAGQQGDWTATIVATPEGGFRMGNPAAPVKVVEFVSLTCPHCRTFAETGGAALVRDYVRGGSASFEIRPFPLDIVAATASQLNRCADPARSFALNDDILATQEQWIARLEALTPTQIREIEAAAPAEQRQLIAQAAGLDAIAARHGVDSGQVRACLTDPSGADRVDAIKAAAERMGVTGTPSFLVNGRLVPDVHDWSGLEPLLRPGS